MSSRPNRASNSGTDASTITGTLTMTIAMISGRQPRARRVGKMVVFEQFVNPAAQIVTLHRLPPGDRLRRRPSLFRSPTARHPPWRRRARRPAPCRAVRRRPCRRALRRRLDELDRVEARGEIGRDADHDAGLAVLGDADDRDHAGADLFLAVVGEALEILHLDALDRAASSLTSPASRTPPAAAARRWTRRRPSRASCAHPTDRARASCAPPSARRCAPACRRAWCAVRPPRSSPAPSCRWRACAHDARSAPRCGARRRPPRFRRSPRSGRYRRCGGHGCRRTVRPTSRARCCRARGPLPIETTRTSSPYFSPNSARAPASRASSTAISRVMTSSFSSTTSLAMSSMRASSSAVIGFGCTKSKRSRSGATSEPRCAIWSPSTCRNASCSRCVAE